MGAGASIRKGTKLSSLPSPGGTTLQDYNEYLSRRRMLKLPSHWYLREVCRAEMAGELGFLGLSSAFYFKVWFDSERRTRTLFTGGQQQAYQKYLQLKHAHSKDESSEGSVMPSSVSRRTPRAQPTTRSGHDAHSDSATSTVQNGTTATHQPAEQEIRLSLAEMQTRTDLTCYYTTP
jgi:hypothetical protein